jgi:hypothetical protein
MSMKLESCHNKELKHKSGKVTHTGGVLSYCR